MAVMKHKAGTALKTGATESPVTGTHTQSDTISAAGELKFYYKADGTDLAVYVANPHKELSFDAVIEATVEDKEIGDLITVTTGEGAAAVTLKYIVTKWDVTESNDDVKKVSIGLRSTTLDAPAQNGGGTGSGGENEGT